MKRFFILFFVIFHTFFGFIFIVVHDFFKYALISYEKQTSKIKDAWDHFIIYMTIILQELRAVFAELIKSLVIISLPLLFIFGAFLIIIGIAFLFSLNPTSTIQLIYSILSFIDLFFQFLITILNTISNTLMSINPAWNDFMNILISFARTVFGYLCKPGFNFKGIY